jgi:3-oxoacyl-[acyl-carrier protein] reductase
MGNAAARALAGEGARVSIAGRGRERAAAAAAELSTTSEVPVTPHVADLTQPGAKEKVLREASEALGGLRGVAITTGLGQRGQRDLLSGSDEDLSVTFEDVLLATCGHAVPPSRSLFKGAAGPS